MRISDWSSDVCSSDLPSNLRQACSSFTIFATEPTGSPLVPAARHQGRGAPCGESFWHWALGADGGHGHAQPPFRSSRLIGAERQPTSDCRQSLQQSLFCYAYFEKCLIHIRNPCSSWIRALLNGLGPAGRRVQGMDRVACGRRGGCL